MRKVNIHRPRRSFPAGCERIRNHHFEVGTTGSPVGSYRAKSAARRPGAMRGKIRIKKNFDEPLPKDLLAAFAGIRKSAPALFSRAARK